MALLKLGNYSDAVSACARALETATPEQDVWPVKAVALYRSKRWDEALAAYEHATALYPDRVALWRGRLRVLLRLHRYQEAWTVMRQAADYLASRG